MGSGLITAFTKFPDPLVNLSKPRLETLAMPTLGMIAARTVNLSHIAPERGISGVQIASTYRRLQRFFQHVRLPQDAAPGLGGAGGCGDGRPAGQAGSGAGPDQLENIVKDVPFTVRLREKMYAALDGERKTWLSTLLTTLRKGRPAVATLNGLKAPLYLAAKTPKRGEAVIVAPTDRAMTPCRPIASAGPSTSCSQIPRPAA